MKAVSFTFCLIFGAILASSSVNGARSNDKAEKDRTISKVVKLLQKMLKKSAEDADSDKKLYAEYRCYVDKNEAEKKQSIKDKAEEIELLSSQIAELQAENGELSTQIAALDRDMTANKDTQKSATAIRKASKKAFGSMEKDLIKGVDQMKEAVNVLEALKLTQAGATSHKKQAALLTLGSQVRTSLTAVSALLPSDKRINLESFLQAPLAAAHVAQGDAIVGILKSLKETFEGNLKSARDSEKAEQKAFDGAIKTLEKSWKSMDKTVKEKESTVGSNSESLGDKKGQLEAAIKQKEDDEDFLEQLLEHSAKKAKNYEERKMLRANEDAAIAEAISILNSDDAFGTFGEATATSEGGTSFLQLRGTQGRAARQQAETILESAASQGHSMRLARVATGLRAGHAFTTVLKEIKKMKTVIAEEGQADQENFDWCKKEQTNSNKDLDAKKSQIKGLKKDISTLEKTIGFEDEKSGLIYDITTKESDLVENAENQKDITATRKKENAAYKVDVMNLADAEDILTRAIKVLERYYKQLAKQGAGSTNLVQEDPKPPELYGDFEGQSDTGNKVIKQLQFILDETKKEHSDADTTENDAQDEYDTEIKSLKTAEENMQKELVKLKEDLAVARKKLMEKQSDLKDTTQAKEAIEQYLEKIKPGCDFIQENKDLRDKNRATEKKALNKARDLIKDTPAYKAAEAKDQELKDGKCKSQCKLDTTSLSCKVCMSGSSKKTYCGDHPGTPGCK